MLIEGHDGCGGGRQAAGEPLPTRPGFWTNHLLGLCGQAPDGPGPGPECFGDDGADVDAMSELLLDERTSPVFRVPFGGGAAVVVYRNTADDPGVDFLLVRPGRGRPEVLAVLGQDRWGPGLSWRELLRIADAPDPAAGGVLDPDARLLLLLPALDGDGDGGGDGGLPADAVARVGAALVAVGAPRDTAPETAGHLLGRLAPPVWHDPSGGSPLSGARPRSPAPSAEG
ncbi:hypothetical protein GCM10010420_40680 [Streptomyces glaucosporus]|uniref:Uncharacterized protein n=1 Tax=Streptomyces glaucosporus TaxID=284044 RepID=A0ABP5VTQ1_9ACTN